VAVWVKVAQVCVVKTVINLKICKCVYREQCSYEAADEHWTSHEFLFFVGLKNA